MNEEELYLKISEGLVENGYVVIENALSFTLTHKLFTSAKDETEYKEAGISSTLRAHIDSSKRSDKTRWLDEDGGAVSEYLRFSEGLRVHLNQHLYLGLCYFEAHFSLYERGAFYEKHRDAFVGSKNRVITTLLYLNEEWSRLDEGELVLYDKNSKELEKIAPKAGTLLVFLSDEFPHEVLVTKKKRYAISGWFRVDKR